MPAGLDDAVSASMLLLLFVQCMLTAGLRLRHFQQPPRPRGRLALALLPLVLGLPLLMASGGLESLSESSWLVVTLLLLFAPATVGALAASWVLERSNPRRAAGAGRSRPRARTASW